MRWWYDGEDNLICDECAVATRADMNAEERHQPDREVTAGYLAADAGCDSCGMAVAEDNEGPDDE